MNCSFIQWDKGTMIPGWIQISAVFPAYGGDLMTIENRDINRDEKVDVKVEISESDLSCCSVVDSCGCNVDLCGCSINPCGCYVETCCC